MSHYQHGLGWMLIVCEVERRLAVAVPGARVVASSEKFGLLRLCFESELRLDDLQVMWDIHAWALAQSQCTCELCGREGMLRQWSWPPQTLCDACDDAVIAVNGGGVPVGYRPPPAPPALASTLPALDPGRVRLTMAWRKEDRQLADFDAALNAGASPYDGLLLSVYWPAAFSSALAHSTTAERERFCARLGAQGKPKLMVEAYSRRVQLAALLWAHGR